MVVVRAQDLIERITGVRPAIGIVVESSNSIGAMVNLETFSIHISKDLLNSKYELDGALTHELGHVLLAVLFSQHLPSLGFLIPTAAQVEQATKTENRLQDLRRLEARNYKLQRRVIYDEDPDFGQHVYGNPHFWSRGRKLSRAENKALLDVAALRSGRTNTTSRSYTNVFLAANEFFADLTAVLLLHDPQFGKRSTYIVELAGGGLGYDMQLRNWNKRLTAEELATVLKDPDPHVAFTPIQYEVYLTLQKTTITSVEILKILYVVLQDEIMRWSPEASASTQALDWADINARVLRNFKTAIARSGQ